MVGGGFVRGGGGGDGVMLVCVLRFWVFLVSLLNNCVFVFATRVYTQYVRAVFVLTMCAGRR